MMLQIMVYAIVTTAALSAAGLCLERLATLWRLPRRVAWVVALLLSICWPPLMILSARPHTTATPIRAHSAQPTRIDADVPIFSGTPGASTATAVIQRPVSPLVDHWNVSALFSDRNLLAAWAVASLAALFYLLAAQLRLRRRMATWRQELLLDQTVLISERTGPALVGIFRPRLVIPRWLLSELPTTQLLVLEHERQHVTAHDPLLIRAATLLLAAFPWNLPLWWQFRRMRRAIELDCDTRVLRTGVMAQTYGEVLLTVVERATRMPMGVIAMSEPVSALEWRIQNLLPDPVRHAVLQAGAVMVVLVLSVGTTFAINAPAIPRRAAVQTTSALPAPSTYTAAPTPVVTIEAPLKPPAQPRIRVAAVAAIAAPVASATDSSQPDSAPRFTVRILPKASGTDAAGDEWNRIEATLATRLRRIAGLTLLTPDADGGTADFEMKINVPEDSTFTIEGRWLKPPPAVPASNDFMSMPNATWQAFFSRPRDDLQLPSAIDSTITGLQLRVFPGAAAVKERLLTQLADPISRPGDRALALVQLLDLTERHYGSVKVSDGPPASDALIRAGVDFASSENDPQLRAGNWGLLRQITSPGLIAPVITALGKETNADVRLVLISILAWNFNTEPTARAALESIARTDQRQLARMAAQRALTGDAGWNDYVRATLKNTQLTDTQRLEPLTYPDLSGKFPQQNPLDQEGTRILGTLLERTEVFSNEADSAVTVLARSPASGGVIAELLRVREGRQVLFDVRNRLLSAQYGPLPFDDSRRALIEDIAARDPDARIRETARGVLDSVARLERTIASLRQRQF